MPELITVKQFCARYSVGKTKTYQLIKVGAITAVKVGRSTRIDSESAAKWAQALPRLTKQS